jgi:Protein of unknown function (DUF3443)
MRHHSVRKIIVFAFSQLLFLAACGGGGADLSGGGSSTGTGGSGSTGTGQTIATVNNTNVIAVQVDTGPSGETSTQANIPYVSVKICAPGSTTNCQTIDHMEVDTTSYGVRVISSVLSSTLLAALTQETVATGNLVECTMFADGYSWGSIHVADVVMGTETAASQSVQIMGDPNYPTVPTACSSTVPHEEDTVSTFGANGIIGVGPFVQDCGNCVGNSESGFYWACPSGGGTCSPAAVTEAAQEASNPVFSFATDNNGVILELPAISASGAATATGALVLGVGTESNNTLGSATVFTVDDNASMTINYKNQNYTGILDSGSNLIFFNDNTISKTGTPSDQVYTPSTTQSLSAELIGLNNVTETVSFSIANADTLFEANPAFAAFDNVGAPNADAEGFDLGLPFFYGRNIFVVIEGKTVSSSTGPFFAL